jgi:hypothetical protein
VAALGAEAPAVAPARWSRQWRRRSLDFAVASNFRRDGDPASGERDAALFGGAAATRRRYKVRYIPGQQIYFDTSCPENAGNVLVDNRDPDHPTIRLGRLP